VVIIGVMVLSLFLLMALTLKVAEWVTSARDELRDRYAGSRWKPAPIDREWLKPGTTQPSMACRAQGAPK
jgi:hypothetical protein